MKVGGPIQFVSRPATKEELVEDVKTAGEQGIEMRILGGGSNIVFPDEGFAGIIIIPTNKEMTPLQDCHFSELPQTSTDTRYRRDEWKEGFLTLEGAEQQQAEPKWLRVGAGVPWGQAVMGSFEQQATGLEWYARIPSSVGGAVFNNIHGEKHFLAEVVQEVTAYTGQEFVTVLPSELSFGYDYSIFHKRSGWVIWDVTFCLNQATEEQVTAAKQQYLEWTKAKSTVQPSGANCGSVFKNLPQDKATELGTNMVAAAWYIDQAGCKGWEEGAMQVYPEHANFMINKGGGTQQQLIALIHRVREAVHTKYNYWLEPEVEVMLQSNERYEW